MECKCCYGDIEPRKHVRCSMDRSHIFCRECPRRAFEAQMQQGKLTFQCLYDTECKGVFTQRERRYYMTRRMASRASALEVSLSISNAGIENLVSCPRCSYAEIHDEPQDTLECKNPKCASKTCTKCFQDSHPGLFCSVDEETEARKAYEEEQTKSILRECPRCSAGIIKDEGCNKISCPCGTQICYICGKDITREKYTHFSSLPGGCNLFTWGSEDGDEGEVERDHYYYRPPELEGEDEDEGDDENEDGENQYDPYEDEYNELENRVRILQRPAVEYVHLFRGVNVRDLTPDQIEDIILASVRAMQ
jgi:hypothetical protein